MIHLDTHVVVWLAFDSSRVSRRANAVIDKAHKNGEGLAICDIALLELTALVGKGRIHLDISLETFLREVETRFVILPITGRACLPLDFQQRIPRIRRTVLSRLLP